MRSLAALLKVEQGMPVVDQAGLNGCYHLNTRWTTGPCDRNETSLPAALHDLALRLQHRKTSVPVLIIDTTERPQPD